MFTQGTCMVTRWMILKDVQHMFLIIKRLYISCSSIVTICYILYDVVHAQCLQHVYIFYCCCKLRRCIPTYNGKRTSYSNILSFLMLTALAWRQVIFNCLTLRMCSLPLVSMHCQQQLGKVKPSPFSRHRCSKTLTNKTKALGF